MGRPYYNPKLTKDIMIFCAHGIIELVASTSYFTPREINFAVIKN